MWSKQAIQCCFPFTVPFAAYSNAHNICGDDKTAVWEILLFVAKVLSARCRFSYIYVVSNSQILPPLKKESRQSISSLKINTSLLFPPPRNVQLPQKEYSRYTTRTLQFDSYQEVVAPEDETLIQLDIAGNLKFGYSSQICNYGRRRQCSGTQRVNHELREKRSRLYAKPLPHYQSPTHLVSLDGSIMTRHGQEKKKITKRSQLI